MNIVSNTQMWTKKYMPRSSFDIIGHNKPIEELKEFVANYQKQSKKSAFVYGPPGNGKTSAVYAVAEELNMELLEVNASDFRTKDQIERIVGSSSQQMSLFMKKKMILIDEVDGMSSHKDKGGMSAVLSIIKKSRFPIVCTANNPFDKKFSSLRSLSRMIEFRTLNYISVFNILKKISDNENIDYDEAALKSLARMAGGDARSAVNDLQILNAMGEKIDMNLLNSLSPREREESIIEALVKVFKVSDFDVSKDAFNSISEDLSKVMLWVDENLPKEYSGNDLVRAYEMMSRADIFSSRIRRWQYYRFLVYVNLFLSAGVASAKDEKKSSFVRYSPPSRILKIWRANLNKAKRNEVLRKISSKTHCSKKEAYKSTLPYIRVIFKKNKDKKKEIAEFLELDKEEIEWISK